MLDLLDHGAPIKVIAVQLEISETRVNQLVRGCKQVLGVSNRYALVQQYRLLRKMRGQEIATPAPPPFPEQEYRIWELPHSPISPQGQAGVTDDAAIAPRIIPAMLDRLDPALRRVTTVIAMAALLCVTAILLLTVHRVLAEVIDGTLGDPRTRRPFASCGEGNGKDGEWNSQGTRSESACCLSSPATAEGNGIDPAPTDSAAAIAPGDCPAAGELALREGA